MKKSNRKEKKEFLSKFCKSSSVLSFKDIFPRTIGKAAQCTFLESDSILLKGSKGRNQHIAGFLRKLRSRPRKEIQVFKCKCGRPCLYIPIIQGNTIYGCMVVLHLRREPDKDLRGVIKSFMHITLREFQKEQELTKLYDTIRPRAIALSTIHTVHRLLTSTLDMDELIERIARLTLQVIRARYCSIMLLDSSKRHLIPKAVINLKNNTGKVHKKYKMIKVGASYAGKVARTGKIYMSANTICIPLVEEDVIGVICARGKINNAPFNKFDMEILVTLAEQAVIAIKNAQLYEEQKKMAYASIKSLAALLDAKSPHTYTHSEKFVKIVLAIAEEMGLRREEITNLRYAALLPDTGRFTIPDEILKKRGHLSKKEYDIVKRRHLESLKILEPLEFLRPAMPIIIHHHERYDGTGYPDGLKGEEIPVGARIMAVADAFEAMVSLRPHKESMISISQAIKEIQNNKATQFDPDVVRAFASISKKSEFKELFS